MIRQSLYNDNILRQGSRLMQIMEYTIEFTMEYITYEAIVNLPFHLLYLFYNDCFMTVPL